MTTAATAIATDLATATELLKASETELVIFDCDGVLVDSERMEVEVLAEVLTWFNIERQPESILQHTRGGSLQQLEDAIAAIYGQPLPKDFKDRYRQHQLGVLADVKALPGAHDAVEAAGERRCVASGGPMDKMTVTLHANELWDLFAPNIFSCYDIGSHKPEPDIYLHAAAAMGVDPTRCVAIEDSEFGVMAAAAAKMFVIGLARDTEVSDLTRAGATVTMESMNNVAELLGAR